MHSSLELSKLRAKRGKAAEKKILMKDYSFMESMMWHLVILATGNENSTYDGQYLQGVGKARDLHRENMKTLETKIVALCN